jgi:hypothetical protein
MNIRKDMFCLFGMGKKEGVEFKTIKDIDNAIKESVIENDKYQVEL